MESTTTDAPLNTCQHCHGEVRYGMTEHGFKGFVHVTSGTAACPKAS